MGVTGRGKSRPGGNWKEGDVDWAEAAGRRRVRRRARRELAAPRCASADVRALKPLRRVVPLGSAGRLRLSIVNRASVAVALVRLLSPLTAGSGAGRLGRRVRTSSSAVSSGNFLRNCRAPAGSDDRDSSPGSVLPSGPPKNDLETSGVVAAVVVLLATV